MTEWINTTIGDQVTLQRGFDITKAKQREGSIPVISSGGISSYHDEAKVLGPGVVLGRKGVVGSIFYVEGEYWPHDTSLWVKDFRENHPRFVYYFFRSITEKLRNLDVGSANPTLNRNHVHPISVRWPTSREDQRTIADLLGGLDDKIELNRRTNETLEAMAQAIFRDWFVDFGPVRRKMEGATDPVAILGGVTTAPPRATELAALFPSSLEGLHPVGWQLTTMGAVSQRVATGPFGSRIKKDNFVAEGVPVIRGQNLAQGFVDRDFVYLTPAKAAELRTSRAEAEDIVLTHRGTLGQVGRVYPGAQHPIYIVSQSQIVLSVDRDKTSPLFVYRSLISDDGLKSWLSNAGGAGVPAIARPTDSLKRIPLVDPGKDLALAFDGLVRPLEARSVTAEQETLRLQETRDYLLPRLMSGEVRVREAEDLAEAAE